MRPGLFLLILLACSGAAAAEDVREQQARAELERELEELTKVPQPWVEISFEGPNSSRYELIEYSFELDGVPLPFNPSGARAGTGLMLFAGQITPGRHVLTTTLVYRELANTFVFSYANLKFKLPGRFSFEAPRGLRLRLPVRVEVDEKAEVKKRLQIMATLEADMLMEVEEGAPPSSAEPVRSEPDAGTGQGAPAAGQAAEDVPAAQSPGPGDAGTPAVKNGKPKRKRIKRHLKNLLQNLAKSSKEEAAAEASRTQVVDEEIPAGASATSEPVLPSSLRAALRNQAGPSESPPRERAPSSKGGRSPQSKKGSKRSRSSSNAAQGDST